MKTWVRLLLMASIAVAALGAFRAPSVFAQATTGELTGRIVDPSGNVVPGVTITVRSDETGLVRTAVTNDSGEYLFVRCRPAVTPSRRN